MGNVGDNPLAHAKGLSALGLQVFPARARDKAPIVKWREYQNKNVSNMLDTWFGSGGQRNFWVMTGRMSGVVVIDVDNKAAEAWWRERLGDALDDAALVKTSKGRHYWFRIPDDWEEGVASWSVHKDDGPSFDVRADATGVIAPPSVHESGHVYVWERPLEGAAEAPLQLLDGTYRTDGAEDAPGVRTGTGGVTRSMLTHLLEDPPAEGGRNDWLARVAGHYAKTYHGMHDLYLTHVRSANAALPQPLDETEFKKTVDSIWRGEHERNAERELDADCGWLKSNGKRLFTQVAGKRGEVMVYDLAEYANFDLVARGIMIAEDGVQTHWAQIVQQKKNERAPTVTDIVIPGKVFGDDKALRGMLSGMGCTVLPPNTMWPKEGSPGFRLQRYLESQDPPVIKITSTLGWDEEIINGNGGYITHDNVITAEEVFSCEAVGVRPNPALKSGGMAPHKYGFEHDEVEAQRVLSEVLTFHDDEATSVFGAWWAACLLKPQIEARTSLFPLMAIEAPSESGKTNGFFDMMTQLNGNTRGETQPTKAALRDMAAAHRNGIVWVDDLDELDDLAELLRAATSGGSLTKMGEDRESVKNTKIVSPIVVSGEALGFGGQKALLDRSLILKVGSPTGRRSTRDPARPQWDDVIELREQYPDGLSAVAGWLIKEALSVQGQAIPLLKAARRGGSGRQSEKFAILRVGAMLLDHLTGHPSPWGGVGPHAQRVDQWIAGGASTDIGANENTLTLQMLPWALRTFNYPEAAVAGERASDVDTPAFVRNADPSSLGKVVQRILGEEAPDEGPLIWFSATLLAQAWEETHRGRVEKRTQTESALRDQANAVVIGTTWRCKIRGGGSRVAYYRCIGGDLAKKILARAQGE